MKILSLLLSSLLLQGCINVASFQPPLPRDSWSLYNEDQLFPSSDPDSLLKYVKRRNKDMQDCGIDYVIGDSLYAKSSLCMESKGWYLKSGPACEDQVLYNDPLCVKWRAQYKR